MGSVESVETFQRNGEVALRLAAVHLEPVFAPLVEKELDRFLAGRSHGLFLQEKAAAIEIKRVRGAWHVVLRFRPFLYLAVVFVHPVVQPVQRADGWLDVEVCAKVTEPAKTGGDVEGNVIVAAPAGEPGPRTVGQLQLGKLPQRVFRFVIQPVVIE